MEKMRRGHPKAGHFSCVHISGVDSQSSVCEAMKKPAAKVAVLKRPAAAEATKHVQLYHRHARICRQRRGLHKQKSRHLMLHLC